MRIPSIFPLFDTSKGINSLRRASRRYFQLLEVMIGAFLLLIALVPFLQIHTVLYRAEAERLQNQQQYHLLYLGQSTLVQALYNRNIRLEDILSGTDWTMWKDEALDDLATQQHQLLEYRLKPLHTYKPKGSQTPLALLLQVNWRITPLGAQRVQKEPMEAVYDVYVSFDPTEQTKNIDETRPLTDEETQERGLTR